MWGTASQGGPSRGCADLARANRRRCRLIVTWPRPMSVGPARSPSLPPARTDRGREGGAADPSSEVGGRFLQEMGELALRRLAPRRDVLARQPAVGPAVLAEDVAGHRLAVHLVGAVVDAGGARVPVHRLQRQVAGIAPRAVDL